MENKQAAGHIFALLTVIFWGTTFISTKILLNDFLPVEIQFYRFIIGLVALTIVYPYKMKVENKKHELFFAAAGFCGITLCYLLENIALTYTMASNVGVFGSLVPIFTALIAYIFLKEEPLRINFFFGFVIAMLGVCFISYSTTATFQLNPLGDCLALAGTFSWAVYSVFTRKISKFGYHIIQTTRKTFFYGILFLLPILFLFDFKLEFERFTNPVNVFHLLLLGLGSSALCYVTWNFAVQVLGPVKTSIYIYLMPVITIAASVIVLNEKITWLSGLGILLIFKALYISERKVFLKKKAFQNKKAG